MLIEYVSAAMRKAHYELLPEDKLYYGEIKGFDGVYATAEPWKIVVMNYSQCLKIGFC